MRRFPTGRGWLLLVFGAFLSHLVWHKGAVGAVTWLAWLVLAISASACADRDAEAPRTPSPPRPRRDSLRAHWRAPPDEASAAGAARNRLWPPH